jgi:hypothetical protein
MLPAVVVTQTRESLLGHARVTVKLRAELAAGHGTENRLR